MLRSFLALTLSLLLAGSVSARTLFVPGDHSTLGAAIEAARSGDEIVLARGTYSPSLNGERFPLWIEQLELTIRGAGALDCFLDAELVSRILHVGPGADVYLENVTFKGGYSDEAGGAVLVQGPGARARIHRAHFLANEAAAGGDAAAVLEGGHLVLGNCLVEGNGVRGPTLQVDIGGSADLEHLTIHGNGGPALGWSGDGDVALRRSIVSLPGVPDGESVGISIDSGRGSLQLEENLFDGCDEGTVHFRTPSRELESSLELARWARGLRQGAPLFEAPHRGDFRLRSHSPGISRAGGARVELGAFGGAEPMRLTRPPAAGPESEESELELLGPSVPNPATTSTTIHFTVREPTVVDLGIYNILGQRIRTLHVGSMSAGEYSRIWDGRDDLGTDVPPGIYFVRVTQGELTESQRLVLVR